MYLRRKMNSNQYAETRTRETDNYYIVIWNKGEEMDAYFLRSGGWPERLMAAAKRRRWDLGVPLFFCA
jgi:hypothetical protein